MLGLFRTQHSWVIDPNHVYPCVTQQEWHSWEGVIIPAWVKCPSSGQRKADHLTSGSQSGRGVNFAPRSHLALSGNILGYQWVVTTRDTAKYSTMRSTSPTTQNPPSPIVNSAKVENNSSQLMDPEGHFLKEKLSCVQGTPTVYAAQIPLNPFGRFSFPCPSLFSVSSHWQLASKDVRSLGCSSHLQAQRVSSAWEFTSPLGDPALGAGTGRKTQLSCLKSGAVYTAELPQDSAEAAGPWFGISSCPRPTSPLPYQVLLGTLS